MAGLVSELSLPGPLCSLLVARGLEDPEGAKAFLRPLLSHLHPPHDLPDLSRAVPRILAAIEQKETILVHGDFDVDGMAGTAFLTRWLRRLGGRVVPFVPHRLRDGYDLGPAGLKVAIEAGASLLLTVDCGTTAHEAVAEARARDLDVIVTDHHLPGEDLPEALAVVNPGRGDSTYPGPGLCGAGVAFKLGQGLAEARGIPADELHPFLDLVGLATVADLVPLQGENRILARYGLKAMAQTRNPGLQALMRESGVTAQDLSTSTLGFVLAPRLNAIGRMGEPADGLDLLLTEDEGEAHRLAQRADELNRIRRETDGRMLDEALEELGRSFDPDRDYGVVLDSDSWHPGVVGIVASRVVERIHRPAVLVAMAGDRGRGSARSIPGFHLLEAIQACGEHLERYGGHRQAAGMEVRRDRLPRFREAFNAEARRKLEGGALRPILKVDVELGVEDLTRDFLRFLNHMEPHGIGNPRPVLLARDVSLAGPARVVGGDHLKLRLRQGRGELEAIGFRMAGRIPPGTLGTSPVDVAFHLEENVFRGVSRLQASLKDLRTHDGDGNEREGGE